MATASIIRRCSMIDWYCSQRHHERSRSHGLWARLLGGIRNKAARGELRRSLPWDLFGASTMVCDSIQMMPLLSEPHRVCSSLSSDRRVAYGCGSAASACPFLCNPEAAHSLDRPAISPSIMYWKIRSMQASMRTASRRAVTLDARARKSESANYPSRSGPCLFRTTMKAILIGIPTRRIARGWPPIPARARIKHVVAP
jgi:hypothetical protein